MTNQRKKRKKIHSNNESNLERLPHDILQHILTFVELPAIISLASCNHHTSNLIYEHCSTLWVKIDFSNLKHSYKLTDEYLKKFLQRVNARKVVKFLSIRNCIGIKGYGLEPLRASEALETIDLRVLPFNKYLNNVKLDETYIVNLLYSIIPMSNKTRSSKWIVGDVNNWNFTLSHVIFREQIIQRQTTYYRRFTPIISEFLLNFHKLLKLRANTRNWLCEQCHCPIMNTLNEKQECNKCGLVNCFECYEKANCVSCKSTLCNLCRESCKCYFDRLCSSKCNKTILKCCNCSTYNLNYTR